MNYNKEEVSEQFARGKELLDRGRYDEAIAIFSKLIELTDRYKESNEDALLTWNVSLNNRGVAWCNLGYISGDKKLFEKGLDDYRTTINYERNSAIREGMTAAGNLRSGERQLDDFANKNTANFRSEGI